ncbi:helix-turn-helix transcriptional regulator [Comamonas sp. CMM03]|uniref:helix-turn-helix transcriptional regulator n=1 Tax=Comamonas sp. CMM03 TaxID=2854781 RepID=UPI001C469F6F|nr:helix-turn-helix transcriptional regulator [Comamonas sp. CMM03]MBV7417168.1 helix-turn-helix transcriptional regulator [Comamonas sp. CMM03]
MAFAQPALQTVPQAAHHAAHPAAPLAAATDAADAGNLPWLLPAGAPIWRRGLCTVAQPCLKQVQHTPRFLFQDAAVLLIAAGRLDMDSGTHSIGVDTPASLLLVDANTCADLRKTPGGMEQRFRSVFLALSPKLLDAFRRGRATGAEAVQAGAPFQQIALDADLASSLQHLLASAADGQLSDERLRYRAMDLLAALAERGGVFRPPQAPGLSGRLRALIGEAPSQHWTAQTAGKALAVSEATLRRRLAGESARFEDVLIDVRMHHAMMLVQTTSWSVPEIAQACGYKSRARFAERFKVRFGYLPSAVR